MPINARTLKRCLLGLGLAVAGALAWIALSANYGLVTTPSMYPTIPPGSMVFIHRERTYHVGQVIEFWGNGLKYVHRIIKIAPNGDITTKGDNPANVPDVFVPATTRKDIIGAVYFSAQWIGFPELIARHPGYGLAWLRAELGPVREAIMVALLGIFGFVVGGGLKQRPDGKDPAEPVAAGPFGPLPESAAREKPA